ncbi:MAG: hypothetical protein HDR00_02575 [Lachnospiraceae bacterium]|nr:hypothetical protein [Lachnospiraceae bacterium]
MISVEDMTELIYIHDAYEEICRVLLGDKLALSFYEGNLGALSRILRLIERNAIEELRKDDNDELWKILNNRSMAPEERAKLLLGMV